MGRGTPFSSTAGPRIPPALPTPRPAAPNFSLPLFTSGEAGRFTPWPCSGLDSLVALIFPTADHRPVNGRFPALPLLLLLPPTLPLPSRLLASFCTAQARERRGGKTPQFGGAGQPRALGSCSSLAKTRGNVRGGPSRKGRNSNSRKPLWQRSWGGLSSPFVALPRSLVVGYKKIRRGGNLISDWSLNKHFGLPPFPPLFRG